MWNIPLLVCTGERGKNYMEARSGLKTRFSRWLLDNHLVPDNEHFQGSQKFPEMLRVINRWAHKVILYISQVALTVMVVLVIMTVTLRYVFSTGIGWAEEVPVLLVNLFAFLACAIGVRDHMHISVNIVYNLFPQGGRGRKVLEYFADFCVLLCGVFLLVFGTMYAKKLFYLPGELPMTGWPTFIQYIPAPMAGFVMTFDSILFLTGVLKKDDFLYSEKEIDYVELVKEQKKDAGLAVANDGGESK